MVGDENDGAVGEERAAEQAVEEESCSVGVLHGTSVCACTRRRETGAYYGAKRVVEQHVLGASVDSAGESHTGFLTTA
jgi:hypothetical protein